jgi:hypothetical protein
LDLDFCFLPEIGISPVSFGIIYLLKKVHTQENYLIKKNDQKEEVAGA